MKRVNPYFMDSIEGSIAPYEEFMSRIQIMTCVVAPLESVKGTASKQ